MRPVFFVFDVVFSIRFICVAIGGVFTAAWKTFITCEQYVEKAQHHCVVEYSQQEKMNEYHPA
eukprot:scaffold389687_cov79-Cyclotella_meneghiniana.AAC.1